MIVRPVDTAEGCRPVRLRIVVDILAVERHAHFAEHLLENLHDDFIFGRQENFVALPLLELLDDDAQCKFHGGG